MDLEGGVPEVGDVLFDGALPPHRAAHGRASRRRGARRAARGHVDDAAPASSPSSAGPTSASRRWSTSSSAPRSRSPRRRRTRRVTPCAASLTEGDTQVILVDTPGLHRPRTTLGGRLNETARAAADGVDVILAIVDATARDRARRPPRARDDARPRPTSAGGPRLVVVVNKIDRPGREAVAAQLLAASAAVEEVADGARSSAMSSSASSTSRSRRRPARAPTALLDYLIAAMPESPFLFPDDEVSDVTEATWIAELVREQLVRKTKQELPHSIHYPGERVRVAPRHRRDSRRARDAKRAW